MIDTHCHLTAPQYDSDREKVIERAFEAGIKYLVCVADSIEDIGPCQSLADKYPRIFSTAGVHPHHAKHFDIKKDLSSIKKAAQNRKCVAIGEIGLDYHYMDSPKETQKAVFRHQLELARDLGLPAIVHCREAVDDVFEIVDAVRPEKLVLHCCSEKFSDVGRFLELGYFLSFTGNITFPKSSEIRETVKKCPIDRIMLETDSPFLAPDPYRGKRNEPAFVFKVAEAAAEIKNMSLEEVANQTTENAVKFFGF